jgi:hypothetical protein
MNFQNRRILRDCEGKGITGCLIFIVLLGIAVFLGIALLPAYYANSNLDSGVKTEVSRAGAHSLDDAAIIKDILDIARRNEIKLERQNIKIQRYAGQVFIEVEYSVPVDLGVTDRNLNFHIKASSFVGTL